MRPCGGHGKIVSLGGNLACESVAFECSGYLDIVAFRFEVSALERVSRYFDIGNFASASGTRDRSCVAVPVFTEFETAYRFSSGQIFDFVIPNADDGVDLQFRRGAACEENEGEENDGKLFHWIEWERIRRLDR